MNKLSWSNFVFVSLILVFSVINYYRYSFEPVHGETLGFKLFSITVLPYLNMFLFGVFLQKNIYIVAKFLANKVFYWLVFYFLSILVTEHLGIRNSGNGINPVSALLLTFVVISAAYSFTDKFSSVLKGNDISYGIYIYHMIFVNFFLSINAFSPEISVVLVVLLTTFVAFLSWWFLEKPMLSLKSVKLR